MKKYLIKQFKKSTSLFLAVLMVLSCWVWMAPQEAEVEAAKFTPLTQYTVTVKWQLTDRKGKYTGGNIKYKTLGDGWGSESSEQTAISSLGDCLTNNKSYSKTFTTTSFPSVIKVTYEGGNTEWGSLTQDGNKARCEVLEILINDKTVWKGNVGYNGANSQEFYATNNEGTAGGCGGTFSWPRPLLVGFNDDTASASDIAVTLNQIGGQDITKTADYNIAKYDCYNQYGVKIADPTNYINNGRVCTVTEQTTYVSGTKNSDDPLSGEDANDIYATANDKDTVVIKPNLQVSNPKASTGAATYYLVRKYVLDDTFGGSVTSKVSAKIDVTYPKYTVTFNGGLDSAKIVADKEYTKSYAPTGYHGANITVPSKTTADGYTFYEYWSKPQPATGAASYNAAASEFAKPCSSEDYASYKADGGTEKDGILTDKDGGKWYDAGKKLDPSSAKTIDVSDNKANFSDTWYAWWLAKDLSVKFYDVDGTFLGEKLVKSGQTQGAITWPTSKYLDSGYTTGAFKFTVDGNIWVTTDGTEIKKNSYTFTKDLILTPKTTRESFQSKYTVTFINPNNGNSVGVGTDGTYDYRANIKSYADTAKGKIPAVPSEVDGDLQYRYELLGWSSVAPTTGKNYHILLEDADFDVNGTAIGLNSDWVVRSNATYYAVYRRYTQTYVVNFTYKDATGADATRQVKFKYGDKLAAPTEYVPYNYVTKGFGYEFANWEYTNADGVKATFAYNGEVAFTSENFEIAAAALDDGVEVEPIVVKALYGAPVATPYSVTFNSKDDEGEDATKTVTVKNEEFILQGTVDSLTSAKKWDDGDYLYTFANQWEITEGIAIKDNNLEDDKIEGTEVKAGDIINTADLITLTPTSNITFKAVYTDPVPYYTVTYIDGAKTYSERVLQGSNVPAWILEGETEAYTPDNYDGEGGTYVFQGWYDEKQKDTSTVNGNKITTAEKVTGNLTLYSQFKFVPDTYEIIFMNHDGTVQLGYGKVEKGDSIEHISAPATKAAQSRAKDEKYEYKFIGWDKAVPTFCEGYDVTYTALYKTEIRYYEVNWYNSTLVNGKWVADKETYDNDTPDDPSDDYDYLLATTLHTYDSKLNLPSVKTECLETAPDGQSYVFAGWYYNDAEGNAVKYERGMKITANMEFYATYTLTDKSYTVTTVVKGDKTKYTVADGAAANIPDPQAGYIDADEHDAFAGWYTDEACTVPFNADATITEDTVVYAKFETSAHELTEEELVDAPTYYAKGKIVKWCSCNKEETKKEIIVDMLTDTVKPTGTIYLGTHSWSSTDEFGAAATDNNKIEIYANAKTNVVVTANDEGDKIEIYNPAGLGKGIKLIQAFIFPADHVLTAQNYGAAQKLAKIVYEAPYEMVEDVKVYGEEQNNIANYAVKLGEFVVADLDENGAVQYNDDGSVKYKQLKDGESYIIYYTVFDKANNQLNTKVRTAKFIYDNTAPGFEVVGNSNNSVVPTYCGSATVTGLEEGVTLTINNMPAEEVIDGEYVINYVDGMDNVLITATDKAGNTTSKKIKLAEHNYEKVEVLSTCTTDGYSKEVCLICGDIRKNITHTATGHVMGQPVIVAGDCVNNGYSLSKCEYCDYEVKTVSVIDEETGEEIFVAPALGHAFEKDGNGEIIYTTVTESTCITNGTAEAYCTECNGELAGGKLTEELALDPAKHEEAVTVDHLDATCTEDGYHHEYYDCCDADVVAYEVLHATGHGEGKWEVITEPTCYQTGEKALKCTICSNIITDENEAEITEVIPATDKHVKVVANPDTYKAEMRVDYKCATEGCPYEYASKELEEEVTVKYTVTFYDENGVEIEAIEVDSEANIIAKDAVTAPEKAETNVYKYTFAGWKGTDGKTYKLPLEVSADMELTASYNEIKIMYTHLFLISAEDAKNRAANNEEVVYATLVGGYGDVRVPSSNPVYKGDDTNNTYKFVGWMNTSTKKMVTDFAVECDASFIAVFTSEAITYDVFFYNGTELVWSTTVKSGEKLTFDLDDPTKAPDVDYHYTFAGWYKDNTEFVSGTAITADTRIYAQFEKAEHKDYTKTTITDATCYKNAVAEYTCPTCGYKYVAEVENTKRKHNMSAFEYDVESGKNVAECTHEDCDYTESKDASSTITFVGADGLAIYFKTVETGKTVKYEGATPTKAADKENTYTFAGWVSEADKDNEEATVYAIDYEFTANENATYVPRFNGTTRKYVVKYVLGKDVVLEEHTGYAYGADIPAYTGDTSALNDPKNFDNYGHKVFSGWNIAEDAKVTGDMYITAVFVTENHDCVAQEGTVGATCTSGGGKYYKCKHCAYDYIDTDANSSALGHKWNEGKVTLDPDYSTQTDGEMTFTCERCGETETRPISGKTRTVKVTAVDANGVAVKDAKVRLFKDGNVYGSTQETIGDGTTIFAELEDGNYTVFVEYPDGATGNFQGIVVNADGSVKNGAPIVYPEKVVEEDTSCKCACHKDTFWGIIYRLFQKIIAMFTGKANCCACPDARI